MKAKLLILLFVLPGCFESKPHTVTTPDYFQKKRECAEFISKLEAKYRKDNTSGENGDYEWKFLDSVCFSATLNTCVGLVKTSSHTYINSRKKPTGESFEAIDLLTNSYIDIATIGFETTPTVQQSRDYGNEIARVKKSAKCTD